MYAKCQINKRDLSVLDDQSSFDLRFFSLQIFIA